MQRPPPRFGSEEYFVYKIYPKKCFTQIYRNLYGDAMLVPTWIGTSSGGRKPTETSVTEFCYKSVNFSLEELINSKVMLFLIH